MKVVYVAGPFRGKDQWEQEQNIRRAEALSLQVWRLGNVAAVCPHLNTRFFQNACPDEVWLEGDLEIMSRCDAVLMTDDWLRSEGAKKEGEVATSINLPIFYHIHDLGLWLKEKSDES